MKAERILAYQGLLRILIMVLVLAAGVSAEAVLLDKIVAVVNTAVFTLSDFEDHLVLSQLFQPDTLAAAQLAPQDREQAFQRFIDQALLREEALRTKIGEMEESKVAQRLHTLERQFGGNEAFMQVLGERGLSPTHARTWLRHQLIVRAFIDRRVRLFVRVSEGEITQYYQQHEQTIAQPLDDRVREQIRRILVEQQVNTRTSELVRELRRKANLLFPP